jgi:ADP-heptose:LPS heptosyltransferase
MKKITTLILDTYHYLLLKKSLKLKKDQLALLCPHGIGDTYYTCSLLPAFQKKNPQIRIILLVKKGHLGVAKMFNLKNTKIVGGWVPQIHFMTIHRFIFGTPSKLTPSKIYFANPFFLSPGTHLQNFGKPGHTTPSVFKGMFGLSLNTKLSKLKVPKGTRLETKKILKKEKIKTQKLVTIAPEANSIPEITNHFWDSLVTRLIDRGYSVVIIGNKYTHPKAKNLVFNISFLHEVYKFLDFISLSKAFISLRSGVCDLTLTSRTKRVFIYPNIKRNKATFHKCYSLENELSDKYLTEIVYSKKRPQTTVKKILKNISS